MATIGLVLQGINQTGKMFTAAIASATELANRVDDVNNKLDAMSGSLTAASDAADHTADRLDSLALSATATAVALETVTATADRLSAKMAAVAATQTAAAAATAAAGGAARTAFGWWSLLFGRISLFGGLAAVGGLHLIVDVLAEVLAVLIPVGVALGAFGVAASDAINNVVRHFTDLHTVMDATQTAIYPMTGALEKLHDAVQPDVYQILGDALQVANTRMGEMQKLAMGTGQVLDQLAARATVALESSGVSKFLQNAVPDLAKLGDIVGNIFGIIGNLLRTMPGYAEVLLSVLDEVTRALEAVTASPIVQGIIEVGLAFHGAFLYVGLAVTATLLLGKAIQSLAKWIIGGIVSLAEWAGATIAAAGATDILTASLALLDAVNPFFWVAAAIVAVAALVFWISRIKTGTQQWLDTLQAGIASQQTWTGLMTALGSAQAQTFDKLGQSIQQLNGMTETAATTNNKYAGSASGINQAYTSQQQAVSQLQSGLKQFNTEQQLASTRLGALGQQVGGTSVALGLLAQAHVKAGDAATANAAAWKQDVQQVLGLQEGLRAMADYAAGNATTALQVLDEQATDQYAAIQKVNGAWDTFTQNMTGTQSSFDTVAQNYSTLSDSASTFTTTLGKLTVSNKFAQTAIDALTPAGVALNQAFTQQVSSIGTLYDSWRTAGIAQNLFTSGVKASIAPLLVYANGSQEATDQLVGLAEQAGYQGPASMKALTQWLGNTSGATQTLKNVSNQATQQEALLTGAMQNQGNLITQQLIGDINQAILKYDGVTQAAQKWGQAIAQDGAASTQAQSARTALINDLIKSGKAAGDSNTQIAAMISTIAHIPASKALQLVMTGLGQFSVQQVAAIAAGNIGKTSGFASGGMVRGPGGPTSDRVPALLSAGEYVVRASSVDKYGKNLFDAINTRRFAAGGLVDAGNLSVLSGQYVNTSETTFQNRVASSLSAAMAQALRQSLSGGVPGSVSSYQNVALTALGMLHEPLTDLSVVLRQMQTESGGSPTAVNRSDSNWLAGTPSVGLMQVIGPTFRAYAGPFAGVGPFAYGVSENPLANIYAGLNYATHRYGPNWTSVLGQGHGYASGGVIGEPVLGLGLHSGSPYSFGENGPETVTPGAGGMHSGPFVTINGLVVRDEADLALISQKLSSAIRMASLGGGFRP